MIKKERKNGVNNFNLINLRKKWYLELKRHGFNDIENERGYIKTHDRRTIAFQNRDAIRDFFIQLDHYLESNPALPVLKRQVLTLYAQGIHIKSIADQVCRDRSTIHEIIKDYKDGK